ncbi:YHS domain-containing (seleno)protein [Algoriphagus antarcticus]|uniref:YHS domain-containing protein n=1 Tax=Algoriphagus antarcticus TaxID=238540 RepID=A0A3E0DK76_9BACT|nr:YHS domain-containing (seleno)protein [Algoriphagus antarcticus]REG83037.1 YHS domain-containing protein [Algoriphagus antarcticus]
MNNYCKKAVLSFLLILMICMAYAQKPEVFSQDDKAIKGYDPVAYFTHSKPIMGKDELKFSHDGANWYFSSQKNLDLFKSNPSKYMPQYGGYCAFGLAAGYKAPISPDAWKVVDDKLYLNYNKKVQADWMADEAEMIKKADKNWPTVKKDK